MKIAKHDVTKITITKNRMAPATCFFLHTRRNDERLTIPNFMTIPQTVFELFIIFARGGAIFAPPLSNGRVKNQLGLDIPEFVIKLIFQQLGYLNSASQHFGPNLPFNYLWTTGHFLKQKGVVPCLH